MRKRFLNLAAACITSAAILFTGCSGSSTDSNELTEVRLNEVGQGADKSMTALISGSADIALLGIEAGIYVYNQGADDYALAFAHVKEA